MRKLIYLCIALIAVISCSAPVTETIPTIQFQKNPDAAESTSQHINVKASTDWVLSISSEGNWVKASKTSGAPDNGDVRIDYSANTSEQDRSALITVKAGSKSAEYSFVQKGVPGGGGEESDPEEQIQLTTSAAGSVTNTTAVLYGSFKDASSTPRETGFEYGTSPAAMSDFIQSPDAVSGTSGSFSAAVDNLYEGTTYYYRAYVVLMKNGQARYYYGPAVSFKTSSQGGEVGTGGIDWFELPLMDFTRNGSYLVNKDDATEYFAYHWCAGSEKNPYGKTARNYTVCYSSRYKCPVWVAAPRHKMYVGASGRSDAYKKDPSIPSDIQYNSKDTGGGCNKGHMLGSAERTSSTATNQQVFFYSNIAPQLSTGFNTGGGGWNILEDWVDSKVCADTLYEVVGCYFDKFTDGYGNTVSPKTIEFGGRSDVSMPTMFYYVLLRTRKGSSGKAVDKCTADELQCVALVRSHTNALKGQKVTAKEMMSVSDLEKITGVTYFPHVPDAPKSSFKASDWGL